jgi:Zn-dependent protease with chaperone function
MSRAPSAFPEPQEVARKAAAFVPAMETWAAAKPGRFRFRLALHIVAGYTLYLSVVLVALLITLVAIAAAFLSKAFWLALVGFGSLASGIGLLQSLHVELLPLKGVPISPTDATRLHEMVNALIKEMGAPKVDEILLVPEANAGILSRYANGLFGRISTTLLIGYPVLQLLSPEEFAALLRHEFGHSAGGHGHLSAWIWRVRETWNELPMTEPEMNFAARVMLPPIYRWFVPKLNAYAAVLSRSHEFDADRHAKGDSPSAHAGLTLVRIFLAGAFLTERFWPEIWKGARDQSRTPKEVFSRLPSIAKTVTLPELRAWLSAEMKKEAEPLDSHPDSKSRFLALGATTDVEAWAQRIELLGFVPAQTAASEFLPDSISTLEQALTEKWACNVFLQWEDVFRHFRRTRETLQQLQQREQGAPLNAEESNQRAACIWTLDGPAAAEAFYRIALQSFPDDPDISFTLGRCLLAQGNEDGVRWMEQVISRASPEIRYRGIAEICEYLERHGRGEEGAAFYQRMAEEEERQRQIAKERGNMTPYDKVIWHGLDPATVENIQKRVHMLEWVAEAYFCRKPTPLSADRPLYLLALKPRRGFLVPAFHAGMTAFDQVAALDCYPVETRFLLLDGKFPTLEKTIRKTRGILLFKR